MSNHQSKLFSDNRKRVQQCTPFDELFKKMILRLSHIKIIEGDKEQCNYE